MSTITDVTYQAAIESQGGEAFTLTIIRDISSGICAPIRTIALEPVSNEVLHVTLEASRVLLDNGYFANSQWTLHPNGIFADIIKIND